MPLRCLFNLLLLLVAFAAAIVLALGYVGLAPGVSALFGSDKPRELGVKPTQPEAAGASEKARVRLIALPPNLAPRESLKLLGQTSLNSGFTDRELTALINSHEAKWLYYPVSDCQIKIHNDGTVEASGILRVDRAYGYAAATGMASELVDMLVDRLKIANLNPAFYVRGTVSAADNRVVGDLQQAEIGRLSIPSNLVFDHKEAMVGFQEDRIRAAGISARSVTFSNGSMQFDGTVPESVAFSPGG